MSKNNNKSKSMSKDYNKRYKLSISNRKIMMKKRFKRSNND